MSEGRVTNKIVLRVSKPIDWRPSGKSILMDGTRGPRGQINAVKFLGCWVDVYATFNAAAVFKYVEKTNNVEFHSVSKDEVPANGRYPEAG